MDAGFGEAVLGALAGGGVAMARHEAARLIRGCLTWLRGKGAAANELAQAAEAFTRGADPDIAAALDELAPDARAEAGAQIDQALADPDQSTELTQQARELQDKLSQAGLLPYSPTGTLVYQPSGPTAIGKGAKAVDSIKVKKGKVTF